ncbi:MAG: hypothetical protein BMS9Abin34_153 [Patescibacteria group bacterium]|nr:MAG: hypothetical protein BMS9Abin34_153 [Patescibacteria group bacterium]
MGLDSATWDLVDPWIKEGKLPFLKSFKEAGSCAKLRSTKPFLTPPAWASIFTGVNPGKHGIFDFFEMEGYKKYPTLSSDRRTKAVWQTVSRRGKRVFVIGVPNTFPPDEVNGVVVSGIGSPGPDSEFVYPPNAKEGVLKILGGEDLFIKGIPQLFVRDKEEFLKRVHGLMEKQKDLCLSFLTGDDWDLLITVFMGLDWIGHFFWKDMDKSHPGYDPEKSKRYEDVLEKIYIKMDNILAEIYKAVQDQAVLMVLSDHGMGPVHKNIHINTLLRKEGYLEADLPSVVAPSSLEMRLRELALEIIRGADRFGLRHRISFKRRTVLRKTVGLEGKEFLDYVVWEKTKAFSISSSGQGIKINLKGRFPRGVVEEKDYEGVVKEIRAIIEDLRDPETGERVVVKTYLARDVYHGPYLLKGPDILVETKGEYILNAEMSDEVFSTSGHAGIRRSGEHREFGIFLVDGKPKGNIGTVETTDITPTILKNLGIQPSGDLDGKPLEI